jgi:hypothetical protein
MIEMRYSLLVVLLVFSVVAKGDDSDLTRKVDNANLDVAAAEFSRVIQSGSRPEWEQLHRYFIRNPERYLRILAMVDHLPWKDSHGRNIRRDERILQFNGSADRFAHGLNRSEFETYVDAYLRVTDPSVETLVRMLRQRHSLAPGVNGDAGKYYGERRLAIAIVKRRFPKLDTSYDWRTFDRHDADDRRELERLASFIRSASSTQGEPSDAPKDRASRIDNGNSTAGPR